MRRWDGLVDGYLRECRQRGLAESTLAGRRTELDRLGSWLKRRQPRPPLEEVRIDVLIRYVRARTAFSSKQTLSSVLSILRCMGDYLVRQGLWPQNDLRWIRGPKLSQSLRVPRRIGAEQMAKLWREAARSGSPYVRHRRVAMLAILYGTGLRRSECEALDLNDWNGEEATLTINGRKTHQQRRVPVPVSVARCIEAYLPCRHNLLEKTAHREQKALLVTRRGNRWRGEQIGNTLRCLATRAGIEGVVTCHRFRHSCASDLLEQGVALPAIQRILGHRSLSSTLRYVHVADPERKRAIARHPINEMLLPRATAPEAGHA
jgi:site-specific recombinase XerD